jgi:hypothetical protein
MNFMPRIFLSKVLANFGFEVHNIRNGATKASNILRFVEYVDDKFEHLLVRIGGTGDGSYLLTEDLIDSIDVCMSPGIGENINFDLELAERGIRMYLADGNISKLPNGVPDRLKNNFFITFKNIGLETSDNKISFDDWIFKSVKLEETLGIQMDIEGQEHLIIPELHTSYSKSIRFILLEFHGFHRLIRDDYLGEMHRKTWAYLEDNYNLVYSKANLLGGSTRYKGLRIPHAVETLWINKSYSESSN